MLQVEDDPVNARLIERALARRPGVRLVGATTVADGLRLARDERPDLVLVDLHLPDGSGRELLRRLESEIPVVLVTADGAAEADGVEVLTKPVDVGRLLELVDGHAPTDERTPSAADSFREREIVEAVPHGIVLLDREGCVLDVTPRPSASSATAATEIVGNPCAPFTHPDDHRAEEPLLARGARRRERRLHDREALPAQGRRARVGATRAAVDPRRATGGRDGCWR